MTETPKYKLYYFEFRSRAEPTRLIFAKAGLPFTDVRIAIDQWDEFKQKMPMGQVPVLEIVGSGEQIWQGTAIARFVARETGLAGKTSLEAARADALVEGVFDLWTAAGTFYMAKMNNEKEKEVAEWAKFKANKLEPWLKRYSGFLASSKSGWLVGEGLTWADITVAEWLSVVADCFEATALDAHPDLLAFKNKVFALDGIKEHVAKRPKDLF